MTMLWLSIGTLLLIALWFLSLPLRRARAIHDWQQGFETDDRAEEQNLAVYERRLAALESACERGEVDVARFEESRHELERNLLEDTEARRRVPLRKFCNPSGDNGIDCRHRNRLSMGGRQWRSGSVCRGAGGS